MAKPVVPSIPAIQSITDPNTRLALQALADGWQLRNGQSGTGDEKFLTKADLEAWFFDPVNGALKRSFDESSGTSGGGSGGGSSILDKIKEISEMLMKTWLWTYLNEGINTLVKPQWIFDTLDKLWSSMAANTTLIETEIVQRTTGDSALITKTDTLAARTNSAIGVIQEQLGVDANGNSVAITRNSGLAGRVYAAEGKIIQTEGAISTEQSVRLTADTAIAKTITDNYVEASGRIAQVQSVAEAAASAATASANKIDTVQARLNAAAAGGPPDPYSPIISLEQRMQALIQADNTMLGSYTLKIDTSANGKKYVAGFGISSEFINGSYQSQFLVNANYFAIGDSTNPGISAVFPFIVDSAAGKVYIKTAMINVAEIDIANVRGVLTANRIQGDINTLHNVSQNVNVEIGTSWTQVTQVGISQNTINGHKPFAMINFQCNVPGGSNSVYGKIVIRNPSSEMCSSEGITFTNESGGVALSTGSDYKTTEACVVIVYARTWAKTGVVNYVGGLVGGLR